MNIATPAPDPCPRCGTPVPSDAPEGLCPRCLGALPLETATVAGTTARTVAAVPSSDELSPLFPQLEILGLLGRGGMGIVYKARQRSLDRIVALKLLDSERAQDAAFAARFVREARLLAALAHPNIVTVYDFGETGGRYYLLMEYVDGVNLRQAMQTDRFTPEQALAIVPPVCDALQYAHERGVVHRDIKPENILLDRDGRVTIADFGIATLMRKEADRTGVAETRAGTPAYTAPEQRAGALTGRSADIWSLGVVLYELLTGELPAAIPQPPSRKIRIDVRIDEIVLRALETSPEARYATAAEMKTHVESLANPPAQAGRSGSLRPVVIVSCVILAGFALIALVPIIFFAARHQAGKKTPHTRGDITLPPPTVAYLAWVSDNRSITPDESWLSQVWTPDGASVDSTADRKAIGALYDGLPSDGTSATQPRLYLLGKNFATGDRRVKTVVIKNDRVTPAFEKRWAGALIERPWAGGGEKIWRACYFRWDRNRTVPERADVVIEYGEGPWIPESDIPLDTTGTADEVRVTKTASGVLIEQDDRPGRQTDIEIILESGATIRSGRESTGTRGNRESGLPYTYAMSFAIAPEKIARIRRFARETRSVTVKDVALRPDTARQCVEGWLADIDAGRYAESYRATTEVFRRTIAEEQWLALLNTWRRPLGKVLSRKLAVKQALPTAKGTAEVTLTALQYRTEFADTGTPMIETVAVNRFADGREAVGGYYIKPAPADTGVK